MTQYKNVAQVRRAMTAKKAAENSTQRQSEKLTKAAVRDASKKVRRETNQVRRQDEEHWRTINLREGYSKETWGQAKRACWFMRNTFGINYETSSAAKAIMTMHIYIADQEIWDLDNDDSFSALVVAALLHEVGDPAATIKFVLGMKEELIKVINNHLPNFLTWMEDMSTEELNWYIAIAQTLEERFK